MDQVIRSQNAAVLFKKSSTANQFDDPSESTDGVLVENPSINFNPQNTDTDEVTGSLDGRGPIVGGIQVQVSFQVYLKGSGVPGVAPEWGPLMECCGWGETLTKTDQSDTDIAAVGASDRLTSTNVDFGATLPVGTVVYVSGFATAGNNGEYRVSASASGTPNTVDLVNVDGTAAGIEDEAAGATVTISRGIAGTAATAGSTTEATLQAPYAATIDLYNGMPILVSGNPATPEWAFFNDYTAARVATLSNSFASALTTSSILSIPANCRYAPGSANIPHGSMELFMDGVLYRLYGIQGDVNFSYPTAQAPRANFTLSCLFLSKTDAAMPTVAYDGTRPGVFRNSLFTIDRAAVALTQMSLNTGNTVYFPPNPNTAEGFDIPIITARSMSGQMDPFSTLVATRNILQNMKDGSVHPIHHRVTGGQSYQAGQRLGMVIPEALYTSYQPGNQSKLANESVNFFPRGQDSGAYISIW